MSERETFLGFPVVMTNGNSWDAPPQEVELIQTRVDPMVKEYSLDNNWRVTFSNKRSDPGERPYALRFDVEVNNGGDWELEFSGQIKRDGCMDIGFNERVMIHYCGSKDCLLLSLIFADGMILCSVRA